MITILQRMKWNTRDWVMPSGDVTEGGYPSQNGYGHEEWNFQIADAYKGNVYGYLWYSPSEKTMRLAEGQFKIYFWSIYPATKQKFLVGSYKNASIASADDTNGLYDFYAKAGIFERRAKELCAVVKGMSRRQALADLRLAIRNRWVYWKCPTKDVIYYPHYMPLKNKIGKKSLCLRFNRPTIISKLPESLLEREKIGDELQGMAPSEDGYYRESPTRLQEIIPKHNKLSNEFCKWLRIKGIKAPRQESHFVDILFEHKNKSYIAEIKIADGIGTTKALRESIGQLIEYNYFPGRRLRNKWLIILDREPSKHDLRYIKRLRDSLGLPIGVIWKYGDEFRCDYQVFDIRT